MLGCAELAEWAKFLRETGSLGLLGVGMALFVVMFGQAMRALTLILTARARSSGKSSRR